jgi:RNA polymerase sigma-70 factor, ECF subfamily
VSRVARAVLRACAARSADGFEAAAAELADVVQETFAKAFSPEARRSYDDSRPFRPYLLQIARNAAIDHWRLRRRNVPVDVEQLAERILQASEPAQEAEAWAEAKTVAVVERYLSSLEDDARRVHDALYVRGLSQREAAAELGMGRQVVRTLEKKLRAGLRRELARAGHLGSEPAGHAFRATLPVNGDDG